MHSTCRPIRRRTSSRCWPRTPPSRNSFRSALPPRAQSLKNLRRRTPRTSPAGRRSSRKPASRASERRRARARRLKYDDAADRFALAHQGEGLVDVGKRHRMGNHRIDLDLAIHIPVDDLGYVGAAARAAERGAAPRPPGDKLERPGRDFLTGAGDADDDALAPATMAAFQRRAHQADIADAFERIVGTADLVG